MDTRKLIQFGKNSFVVSVPKDWVRKNKLEKGDGLIIQESNNKIELLATIDEKKKETRKITISADNKDLELVRIEIVSAYLTNYDIIEIVGKRLQDSEKIKSIFRNLAGLEIIDETSTKITAKDLLNMEEISIDSMIRRMDIIIRSMIDDAILCTEEDVSKSVFERDREVNRVSFLAHRVLRSVLINPEAARKLDTNPLETLIHWNIFRLLESIGDKVKRIALYNTKLKMSKIRKRELQKITDTIKKSFLDVMKAYYSSNRELAYAVEIENDQRMAMCNDFLKKETDINTFEVLEHLKGMSSSIKHIARNVITKISS